MSSPPPLGPLAHLRWSVVRPLIERVGPERLLEIGCGLGSVGARLAGSIEYVGLEADPTSYDVARSRIEPVGGRVVNGTTAMLDPDDRFDLVCAFEVIEHIEDDTTAISEWATHVAPGGTMILSAPAWTRQYGAWDEYVGHFRRYEPEALDQLLAAAGCTDVSHHLYGWPLGFVTEAARNRVASKRIGNLGGSMSTRTAASGRTFQPNSVVGVGTRLGTVPFAVLQKLRPGSGVGVVSIGVRP